MQPPSPYTRAELRLLAGLLALGLLVQLLSSRASLAPQPGPGLRPLLVDINHASRDELCALPGVGPATAAQLLEARPLSDTAALKALLGARRYARVAPWVTLAGSRRAR